MGFVVLYDANVLYPSVLRDLLIRIAQAELVQAKWTDAILDETFRSLRVNRPDLDPGRLDRTRILMNQAVRDCLVTGFEPLIAAVTALPDPNDRHVVAAAIRAKAQVIVTANLSDFPASALSLWGVEAKHPEQFLMDEFHLDRSPCTRPYRPSLTPGPRRRARQAMCSMPSTVPASSRQLRSCDADQYAGRSTSHDGPHSLACRQGRRIRPMLSK